ncbi:hypothetical protein KUH03_42640 [Sphingobacterium sp. E70]|uniref:hypothetical protein n=1 Tax=Sphingobacterium sp. E70 TaxID=2853439 RepID=UPI00211C03E0|nr:hypothetical protein [Sphingobacterium sp. E70]ULT25403.1 hypothetical protein KUH03_42640 [Sphingobacterium sp. E70]
MSINDALNTSTVGQVFTRGKFKTGEVNHNILAGLDMGKKFYVADWSEAGSIVDPSKKLPVNADGEVIFNIYNPVYGNLTKDMLPVYDRSKSLRERGANYLSDYSYSSVHIQDEVRFCRTNLGSLLVYGILQQRRYLLPIMVMKLKMKHLHRGLV